MWTRAELKTRAKAELKGYYWPAVGFLILAGLVGTGINILTIPLSLFMIFIPFIGSFIFTILVDTFLNNIIIVGENSYFIKNELEPKSAGMGEMFHCFHSGRYVRAMSVMFFKWLFQSLWSLLLVVPGIVKGYEYRMIPYLAAEYPEKDRKEIFALSRQMMDGNKMNVFVLDLSFIGWAILCLVTFGIAVIFVNPYYNATYAELYLQLKEEKLGIPRGSDADASLKSDYVVLPSSADEAETSGIEENPLSAYLVGVVGAFSGADIPVGVDAPVTIGRDPGQCNIVLDGQQISRVHLQVEFDGTNFQVMDLSTNGTFDMQDGRLPKGEYVTKPSGTYLQLGTGEDVFLLECR